MCSQSVTNWLPTAVQYIQYLSLSRYLEGLEGTLKSARVIAKRVLYPAFNLTLNDTYKIAQLEKVKFYSLNTS